MSCLQVHPTFKYTYFEQAEYKQSESEELPPTPHYKPFPQEIHHIALFSVLESSRVQGDNPRNYVTLGRY